MKTPKEIVKEMSLEEKAAMCTGLDFWHLHGVPSEDIPVTMVTDGPHGLRKQSGSADPLGINASEVATCFPSASGLAASFDPELMEKVGSLLGELAADEDVSVVLGPGVNIKRSPLCGRNFEYFSEDPLLSAKMGSGIVRGIQSQNVGACPKHFLANNQEYYRMTSNSVVDDRTLREIYLAPFEGVVKESNPWTLMCSYNKVNGTYACENKTFLTDILKEEWGFKGYVMTDWGALDEPVESLKAGLDLGMPGPVQDSIDSIKAAIDKGELEESLLDEAVERILNIILHYTSHKKPEKSYDFERAHTAAREIASQCAVLLKNEAQVLPLSEEERVVFIGQYAVAPRYQGGGSSHINAYKVSSAWDAVKGLSNVSFSQGFGDQPDEQMLMEAVEAAKKADKAVIFAGLTDADETEGLDRRTLEMPSNQKELIEAVAKVQPNTVVVLYNGAPVTMPWLENVKGVLEMYLTGEATGEATVDVLYGRANPSGRLAETFPMRLEDTPAFPYYGTERNDVVYREGLMVGYRHYITRDIPVLFPFGYGLSYTSFDYSNLKLSSQSIKDTDKLMVSVDVTNTGTIDGFEVVQCYVSGSAGEVVRPLRELRAFKKIYIPAHETVTVTMQLDKRAFAYWNTEEQEWVAETGSYEVQICRNAEEVILAVPVQVENTIVSRQVFTVNSPMGDMMNHTIASQILGAAFAQTMGQSAAEQSAGTDGILSAEAMAEFFKVMPIRSMLSFAPGTKREQFEQLIATVNEAISNS